MTGQLILISAASGTGKSALVKALVESVPHLGAPVSYTTRRPRANERIDKHYHFVSRERFEALISEGRFLEHAAILGERYGTDWEEVRPFWDRGDTAVLVLDWRGVGQVRRQMRDVVSVFVLPPSWAVLESRLRERAHTTHESGSELEARLGRARDDLSRCTTYDYLVVSKDFDTALTELREIAAAYHCSTPVRVKTHAALLRQLLSAKR